MVHLDLGIAYAELELTTDAIAELELALQSGLLSETSRAQANRWLRKLRARADDAD